MNYLVLLRHGQSQWNLENKFTGFVDVDLSELGEKEARIAGERLKDARFDQVFTSTLKRAIRTAEIALDQSSVNDHLKTGDGWNMVRHDDMRERDYGDLAGLNKAETAKKYGDEQVHIWRRSYDVRPPGGECLKDVVERVTPYFKEHIEPALKEGKNVLVAAHGNTLRAMLIVLGDRTPDNIMEAEIPTGVPLVFEYEDGKPVQSYFLDSDEKLLKAS